MGKWKKLRRQFESAHESNDYLLKSYDDLQLADNNPPDSARKRFWSFPFRKKPKRNRVSIEEYTFSGMPIETILLTESYPPVGTDCSVLHGQPTARENETTFYAVNANATENETVLGQLKTKDAIIAKLEAENAALKDNVAVLEFEQDQMKDEMNRLKRLMETELSELLVKNSELLDKITILEKRNSSLAAFKSKQTHQINRLKVERRRLKKDQSEAKRSVVIVKSTKELYVGCRQKDVKIEVERTSSSRSKQSRYSTTTSSMTSSSMSFGSRPISSSHDELEVENRARAVEQWTLGVRQSNTEIPTFPWASVNMEAGPVRREETGSHDVAPGPVGGNIARDVRHSSGYLEVRSTQDDTHATAWEKLLRFDKGPVDNVHDIEGLLPATIAEESHLQESSCEYTQSLEQGRSDYNMRQPGPSNNPPPPGPSGNHMHAPEPVGDSMLVAGLTGSNMQAPGPVEYSMNTPGLVDYNRQATVISSNNMQTPEPANYNTHESEPVDYTMQTGGPADYNMQALGPANCNMQAPGQANYSIQTPCPADYNNLVRADCSMQAPGPGDYNMQAPGQAKCNMQEPGRANCNIHTPDPTGYNMQASGLADYNMQAPGPADYNMQAPGPTDYNNRVPASVRIPSIGHIWQAVLPTYETLHQHQRPLPWEELPKKYKELMVVIQQFCGENPSKLMTLLGARDQCDIDLLTPGNATAAVAWAVQLWMINNQRGPDSSSASWPWRLHQILDSVHEH